MAGLVLGGAEAVPVWTHTAVSETGRHRAVSISSASGIVLARNKHTKAYRKFYMSHALLLFVPEPQGFRHTSVP